jgi:Nucleoplasmin-like domain
MARKGSRKGSPASKKAGQQQQAEQEEAQQQDQQGARRPRSRGARRRRSSQAAVEAEMMSGSSSDGDVPIVEEVDSSEDGESGSGDEILIPEDVARFLAQHPEGLPSPGNSSSSDSDDERAYGVGGGMVEGPDGELYPYDGSDSDSDDDSDFIEPEFWSQTVAGGKEHAYLDMTDFGSVSLNGAALTGGKKGERCELWADLLASGDYALEDAYDSEDSAEVEIPRKQVLLCTLENGRTDQFAINDVTFRTDDDVRFFHTGSEKAVIHLTGVMTIDIALARALYASDDDSEESSVDGDDSEDDAIEFDEEDIEDVSKEKLVEKLRQIAQMRKDGQPIEWSGSSDEDSDESPDEESESESESDDGPAVVTAFGTANTQNKKRASKESPKRPQKRQKK